MCVVCEYIEERRDERRSHMVYQTADFLQEGGVNVLPWPPRSSDLNPIEQVLWEGDCPLCTVLHIF